MTQSTPAIPQPKPCTRSLHIERAQQGFTMCVDCRRPLFPAPKNKCRAHSIYACNECYTQEEIAQFAWERNGWNRHAAYDVEDEPPTETAQATKGQSE